MSGTTSESRANPSWFALVFGFFLGLTLLKFGNPVILHDRIEPPHSLNEFLLQPWPLTWTLPCLLVLGVLAFMLWIRHVPLRQQPPFLWLTVLPLLWLGWQGIALFRSVDLPLASATWIHLAIVVGVYLVGLHVLSRLPHPHWIWVGLILALVICLVRATNQRLVEFPRDHQFLMEGDANGWTQVPLSIQQELMRNSLLIETNGLPRANPIILIKLQKARVHGTLVYPNALSNLLLLLTPPLIALVWMHQHRLRPGLRHLVLVLGTGLLVAVFLWTGSKAAFLVTIPILAWVGIQKLPLFSRLRSGWIRLSLIGAAVLLGLILFSWRFMGYFQAGATSAGARMDYWRAAIRITCDNPLWGTGPGTFQRPYAEIKPVDAEMTRLVHNDYLQQFSDSGLLGGLLYLAWIGLLWLELIRNVRRHDLQVSPLEFGLFCGLAGWFLHGLFEFSLYIPALAWTAFTLAGFAAGLARQRKHSAL